VSLLVVAAVSARLLAEAAARDGFDVIALDLFGDEDTRRASRQWRPIGAPGARHIDRAMLLAALADVARSDASTPWVPGSGFDGDADLLEQGAALLPLAGTAPGDVRRLRDPRRFFACLDTHGIGHPEISDAPTGSMDGWLAKDAGGCGGWHIRRAAQAAAGSPASVYFQRESPGAPMSATFLANGSEARVLGVNRLLVRRFGSHPFVFRGVVGPVPVADGVMQHIGATLRHLTTEFRLRGLGSLDFLLDGDDVAVLEVNSRAPASLALYPDVDGRGVVTAHLRACQGKLPAASSSKVAPVSGTEIVFARKPLRIGDAAAQRLATWPGCHDLPQAGTSFAPGDPVCSLQASGADSADIEARLANDREALLAALETLS
jgi:predicted ATP-grasp superfamily ATP-dependent carboligase